MGADNGAVDRSVEDEAGYRGGFLRPALHVVHAFATPFAVMFTTAQALVDFFWRFRPPGYRAALIHLSASSRLSGPDLLPVGVRPRFGDRRVERFADHTPHNEESGHADEGSEPEGGEPYHEGQGYRESARDPGRGGELPRHPRLGGSEPTRQHARGAGERADREDEDDQQERLPRPNAQGAEIDRHALQPPSEKRDTARHHERPEGQKLVRRPVEVPHVGRQAVQERELAQRSLGEQREPLRAQDRDPHSRKRETE